MKQEEQPIIELDIFIITEKLRSFVPYEEAIVLRNKLKEYADKNYKQKYNSDYYLRFLNEFDCRFEKVHPQDANNPYFMKMFSIPTQHICGDNIYQLLDKAIDIFKENNGLPEIKIFTYNKNENE